MDRTEDAPAIVTSCRFVARHLLVVAPLCAVIAMGRFVQTGYPAFAPIPMQVVLEVVVEGGRIALAIVVIGAGSLTAGIRSIRRFFAEPKAERQSRFARMKERLTTRWRPLAEDVALYLVLALLLNRAIDWVAGTPWMQARAAIVGADLTASDAQILLLKNISVIPLTIVFQIHFAARLWLSDEERTAWLNRR